MVFYRKYRPQKIQELDSQEVRNSLSAILSSKEVPHAFLFSGPKGLGKTSAARIVAKIVNCERQKLYAKRYTLNASVEPCNKCFQCTSITEGNNLDILEIDAASNRGIDEIRDLRDKIKLAPLTSRIKIYIIDEVHMLTREAFNALLKTLEEPPRHVMFILCTTEPEKLPETIASRCSIVNFKRAKKEEIERAIFRIIKEEKIKIDKEAILRIGKLADGSFRDAVKILEHLRALAGRKKITQEIVEKEYHSERQSLEFLGEILKKKTKKALAMLEEMVKEGVNIKILNEQLLYSLHDLLLDKLGIGEEELELKNELEIDDLRRLIGLFERAALEAKTAVIPQLPLELAIIEWSIGVGVEVGNENFRGPQLSRDETKSVHNRIGARQDATSKNFVTSPRPKLEHTNIWEELIRRVKPYNHSVAGVLRGCKIREFDGKKLVIETNYKFHKERLEEKKTRDLIGKVSGEIVGNPVSFSVLLRG